MLEEAYSSLMEDLPLHPSAPGGMIQYRRALSLRYSIYTFYKMSITMGGIAVWKDFQKHFLPCSYSVIACVAGQINTLQ